MLIEVYTDGSCPKNPGIGGWGAVIYVDDKQILISGGEGKTTNNRMELMAAIKALQLLESGSEVVVKTDSRYLQKGITQWIHRWMETGWKNGRKPIKNRDLWEILYAEKQKHKSVSWKWVKGHSGHKDNELADTLAGNASKAYKLGVENG